ncbi:MAG: hypothetical protein IJ764_05615 [Bacteroidales bacterium]|nr:hypothetical protein [Bacteroidales bacterium]
MKKSFKVFLSFLLIAGIATLCGITTSCASSEDAPMYRSNHGTTKVIKSNYKVTGTNRKNSATYRSY